MENTKSALLTNIHSMDSWFALLVAVIGIIAGIGIFLESLLMIIQNNNLLFIPLILYGILMVIFGAKIITERDFKKFQEFTRNEAILTIVLVAISYVISL
jgi:hypothetical protein